MGSSLYRSARLNASGVIVALSQKQLVETLQIALRETLANLHTVAVARVTAISDDRKTLSCQPTINREVDSESVALPEFVEVPPITLQGGGSYTAWPIAAGDYCLLVVTERCFDRWYEGQNNRRPAEFRMHDYSDGFALVGVNTRAGAITIPELITQIGNAYFQGDLEHQGDVTHVGNYDLTGNLTVTGDLTVNGGVTVTGDATIGGISFLNHVHPGDSGGTTGPPQ